MRILVDGPIAGSYSLAVVNREFASCLIKMGLDVYVTQREGPDPLSDRYFAQHQQLSGRYIPYDQITNFLFDIHTKNDWPVFSEPRCAPVLVSHCYAWEETIFPPHIIMELEKFEAIFTTSSYTLDALRYSGYTGMARKIGNGVSHLQKTIHPFKKQIKKQNGDFVFLHVSSGLLRKGMDIGIKAFISEFRDEEDVRLKIKTHPSETNIIYTVIAELAEADRKKIDLIDADLSHSELVNLIEDADFCFFPSRGEGFLLPAAEAMLLNTPVCVTACGGNSDFCNNETCILIPTHISKSKSHISDGKAAWFDFHEDDVRKALREARNMDHASRKRLIDTARSTVSQLSWEVVAENFLKFVKELAQPEATQLSVPSNCEQEALLLTTYNQKCGIATYSANIVNAFANAGQRFQVIGESIRPSELAEPDEQYVARIWTRDENLVTSMLSYLKTMRQAKPLLIQYHPGFFSWRDLGIFALEARRYVTTVTIEIHSTDGAETDVRYFLGKIGGATNIIVHNGTDYVKIVSNKKDHKNVYLMPHPTPTYSPARNTPNIPAAANAVRLFSFGICWPHKQFEKVIEVVRRLKNRGIDASATIITSIVEADATSVLYAHDLWNYREVMDLSSDVEIINDFLPTEEIVEIASTSTVALFPYKDVNEGASGAVRVAMASGIPILTSNSTIFEDIKYICASCDVDDARMICKEVQQIQLDREAILNKQAAYIDYTSWPKYVKRIERIMKNEISC